MAPRFIHMAPASAAIALTALAATGCTALAGAGVSGAGIRSAKVVAIDRGGPVQTVDITHYHGATVVRERATAPAELDLAAGDRVRIDHSARPPRVLSVIRAN